MGDSRRLSSRDKLKLAKLQEDAVVSSPPQPPTVTQHGDNSSAPSSLARRKYDTFHPFRRRKTTSQEPKKPEIDPNHGYPTAALSNPCILSIPHYWFSDYSGSEASIGYKMRSPIAIRFHRV